MTEPKANNNRCSSKDYYDEHNDAMLKETITDKAHKFKGRVFSAEILDVSLSDGSRGKREIVRHNGGAAVVPIDKDNMVYLVRQFRSPFEEVLLEIPAGKLEIDEDPFLCAQRELTEETGLFAEEIESLGVMYPSPGYCSEILHLYMATGLTQGEACPDEGEFLSVIRMPVLEVLDMIDDGRIKDAKTIIAIMKLARRLKL